MGTGKDQSNGAAPSQPSMQTVTHLEECDCRRPAPDHSTKQVNHDAIQCRGCRGWITRLMVMENRWGLSDAEAKRLFGGECD